LVPDFFQRDIPRHNFAKYPLGAKLSGYRSAGGIIKIQHKHHIAHWFTSPFEAKSEKWNLLLFDDNGKNPAAYL